MTRVIGVDAYALGWVAVELHDGAFARAMLATTLYEVSLNGSVAAVIGVDVPLGMMPARRRAADALVTSSIIEVG
jgi:Protein of unknown function (DUF429)